MRWGSSLVLLPHTKMTVPFQDDFIIDGSILEGLE